MLCFRPGDLDDFYEDQIASDSVGFQVDRVKHAEPGEAKVRLTVYNKATGKVGTATRVA